MTGEKSNPTAATHPGSEVEPLAGATATPDHQGAEYWPAAPIPRHSTVDARQKRELARRLERGWENY
jgi:hypothetical protein